jgi:polar amino acid transport system substrate-binding protein
MFTVVSRTRRAFGAVAAIVLTTALAACGSGNSTADASAANPGATSTAVVIGDHAGAPFSPTSITVPRVDAIRAKLPKAVLDSGELRIGFGALPAGFAPLVFTGDDQRTLTGSEPDVARLVAAVLGLKPVLSNSTWENLFVGLDSGRTDVGFSNITDTENRKQKYDFASYRQDNLGFEVTSASTWNFGGNYENLVDMRVAVGRGTNQEKILLDWQAKLRSEGKTLTVSYFPDIHSTYLALASGKIDVYFGPNPEISYHIAKTAQTVTATRSAGTWSGAGATLQGMIGAATKKGNGLVEPLSEAINYLIEHGQYASWLRTYHLAEEARPPLRSTRPVCRGPSPERLPRRAGRAGRGSRRPGPIQRSAGRWRPVR